MPDYQQLANQVQNLVATNTTLVTEVARVRDAAMGILNLFPTIEAGIAGSPDGGYFSVPGSGQFLTLYRRNGSIQQTIAQYPTLASIQQFYDTKVDKIEGKGLSTNDLTNALLDKLNGIEAEATKNATDAELRDRVTHTGEQAISTVTGLQGALDSKIDLVSIVDELTSTFADAPLSANQGRVLKGLIDSINALLQSDDSNLDELQEIVDFIKLNRADLDSLSIDSIAGLQTALDGKVDKVTGKQLSTEDYTTAEKNKLTGVEAGAQVNVATNLSYTASTRELASSTGSNTTLPEATTSVAGLMNSGDKTKLNGIATGATANATDAQLRARSTHTGTQPHTTITGLGTAATSNVTTSATDTTAGRLLKVGDFGQTGNVIAVGAVDANTLIRKGSYWVGSTSTNTPVGSSGVLEVTSSLSTTEIVTSQRFTISANNSTRTWFRSKTSAGSWLPWREIYHTGNTGTAVTRDVTTSATDTTAGRLLKVGDFGLGSAIVATDTDANAGTYVIPGITFISSSGGSNFPFNLNGRFTVQVIGAENSGITQFFTQRGTNRIFQRGKAGTGSAWTPWIEIYHTGSVVGTVSQSGGVPTGAIIQRGSNSNGEFVRYADGTQICFVSLSFATEDVVRQDQSYTFPATFAAIPNFQVTVQDNRGGVLLNENSRRISSVAESLPAADSGRIRALSVEEFSFITGGTWEIGVMLFGRWY